MHKFIKREDGVWDAPNCYECCSDCSNCSSDCECPLDFEDSCINCIFNDGNKKCSECRTNARTKDKKHNEDGYWYMCDSCISKILGNKKE